ELKLKQRQATTNLLSAELEKAKGLDIDGLLEGKIICNGNLRPCMPPIDLEQNSKNRKLLKAAQNGEAHTVLALLNTGAHIDTTDDKDNTALHIAAFWGRDKIVRILLDHGASVDKVNNDN